ncbi:MAG: hypothetical protein MJE66_00210 [Proteobacteria bacterium]|nr:hypothetical protein [Pseudomonadota bacterium]
MSNVAMDSRVAARARRLLISVVFLGLVSCGGGPLLVFPGGELEGNPAAAPSDWDFAREISTVQLETHPEEPYSVNIWATGMDGFLYIHAGANRAAWVEHIEVDPAVRVRIEEQIYPLSAVRVEDAGEFARFADAYEAKYGSRPRNENVAEVYLFRLAAR